MRARFYDIIRRAVEEGLAYGWQQAHKHTDTPTVDIIKNCIETAIMTEICEYIDFLDFFPKYDGSR